MKIILIIIVAIAVFIFSAYLIPLLILIVRDRQSYNLMQDQLYRDLAAAPSEEEYQCEKERRRRFEALTKEH